MFLEKLMLTFLFLVSFSNPDRNSWCDPFKTWQKSYSFDPVANLTSDEAKLVLGGTPTPLSLPIPIANPNPHTGQHLLWTEQSGPANLDPVVWPRAATSAEIYWTGNTLPDGSVRAKAGASALPRLHEMAFRMQARGVNAIPLQPEWCALRPGACDGDA